ncbi:MAG: lasso peptide biosynthesis B2 protein [Terracidiphilus sp.]
MKRLVIESCLLLLSFELAVKLRAFERIRAAVQRQQVRSATIASRIPSERLSRAMDYACVFYFKKVQCLQRSAATTLLLRRHGWNAEMVTGVQIIPYNAHAWVEIHGEVVNDKPYMHDIYQVLERY